MTPAEIYSLPVARTAGLSEMLNSDPWPLFPVCAPWGMEEIAGLEVKVHGLLKRDPRRFWSVFSVWLDGKPVACGRMAGREGDDSYDRWITDEEGYRKLASLVRTAVDAGEEIPLTDATADLGVVVEWYGERVVPGQDAYLPWNL